MIQVVGLGTQDDFPFAQRFLNETGVATPDMLWDPSFETWRSLGIRVNSEMMLLSGDLTRGTSSFFGFGESEQQEILDALPQFA